MSIPESIAAARDRIDSATSACGRTDSVTLELAVKTRTPEECRAAATALAEAGLPILLGHNRVQEARATVDAIREVPGARLHLIGPLQSNKINHALACVDAIESLDSPVFAAQIDARAPGPFPVFVEVNVSGEATKHGCAPADVARLIDTVEASAHLQLSGFMTVGLNSPVEAEETHDERAADSEHCEDRKDIDAGLPRLGAHRRRVVGGGQAREGGESSDRVSDRSERQDRR